MVGNCENLLADAGRFGVLGTLGAKQKSGGFRPYKCRRVDSQPTGTVTSRQCNTQGIMDTSPMVRSILVSLLRICMFQCCP